MKLNKRYLHPLIVLLLGALITATAQAAPKKNEPMFGWRTVVNNNDLMPPLDVRNFNSYNQPSVNVDGLVVFRARSRGGGGEQPTHGIYTRDMADDEGDIISILDRSIEVPYPNNLGTTFVETPSFPRIDMNSNTIATRGNHQPVWNYVIGTDPDTGEDIETRAGTTGIYTNPFGELITGVAKLGNVPAFSFFEVPEFPGITFEVFPGAPAVTQGDTIVFKGNYTAEDASKTGVYYRVLENEPVNGAPASGTSPVVLIANNTDTVIPGTDTVFGSTAPPSAAGDSVVFAGFDDEDAPTLGGIYLASLGQAQPPLTTLVSIGGRVPGESRQDTFNGLGEGMAFDGHFVGFWGAWGEETRTVRLYCAEEGNKDRIAYCNQELICKDTGEEIGDPNSECDDENDPNYGISCYQEREVPVNQGIFVHDIKTGATRLVAKTGAPFDDFLFWNYSGKTPCVGGGHSEEGAEDDGEPARWRSSAFVTVAAESETSATFRAAFKARTGELDDNGVYVDPVDGIYLRNGPGQSGIVTVLDTTMDGQQLDAEAPVGSIITELGIEREGLRGDWLTINASMGEEEDDGMAGIYITKVP